MPNSQWWIMEIKMKRVNRIPLFLLALLIAAPLFAQQPARQPDPSLLSLDTIFTYRPQMLGWHQWQSDGGGYLMLEPAAAGKGALDIVRYDAATGAKTILVSAQSLTPPGASSPLTIEEFTLSDDNQRMLIFTNSERVWRSNTRGDYWFFDLKSAKLRKLGGDAKPSTLMFAKFSPDAARVGYVRENNIYVENLDDGRIMRLTSDGAEHTINGTFDWVYEEELFCRDGWRWSPDGKLIAYWRLDSSGVKEFKLINDTDELYPKIISFPYPKAGEMNSAARVGVVSSSGGATRWFDVPGDPREHYVPRMEWAASSSEVIIQQLNRLQNTSLVMLGDIATGRTRTIMTEKDEAWVDVSWGDIDWDKRGLGRGDAEWIDDGKRFLWTSDRDGWRHIYSISRDGNDVKCITRGNFDVIAVEGVDKTGGWLYYYVSPDDPKARYLYRARLTGGDSERLSPAAQRGGHTYALSPRGDLALHTYSAFNTVPVTDIVRLPQHTALRTLIDNKELRDQLAGLKQCSREFFR